MAATAAVALPGRVDLSERRSILIRVLGANARPSDLGAFTKRAGPLTHFGPV